MCVCVCVCCRFGQIFGHYAVSLFEIGLYSCDEIFILIHLAMRACVHLLIHTIPARSPDQIHSESNDPRHEEISLREGFVGLRDCRPVLSIYNQLIDLGADPHDHIGQGAAQHDTVEGSGQCGSQE